MRILYGVTGEGLGHAMRSRIAIAELLRRGHHVKVAASGRAATLLSQSFMVVVPIHGLFIEYRNGTMARGKTVLANLKGARTLFRQNRAAYEAEFREFDPDLCISDFDSFAHLFAKRHGKPVIALDHQHILDRCEHEKVLRQRLSPGFASTRAFVRAKMPGCDWYVVPTFYFPEVKRRDRGKTTLIPPILRDEILRAKPTAGEEVLVYQTSRNHDRLVAALATLNAHHFVVYGMGERPAQGHVRFARFDEKAFVADLAAAKAVIAGGGFTTLSEALFLGKPVLSIPVKGQHEQELNAAYLETLGYGARAEDASPGGIGDFLEASDLYRAALRNAPRQNGNEAISTLCDQLSAGTFHELCAA